MGTNYFVMVGRNDNPIFELDFTTSNKPGVSGEKKEDHRHLNQFIVHAALDVVEETLWTTPAMNLKVVDKFNEYFISAYVTAGSIKLMLLHDTLNSDGIKNFFQEVHEIYVKVLLNPFYDLSSPITSPVFQHKVRLLGKKYL